MTSPKLIISSTTIDLNDYKCEVIPKWQQERVILTSCLTGKKTAINVASDDEKGKFECRIRVFDSDSKIKELEEGKEVTFYLYADESNNFTCIIKEFLPIAAGKKHRRISNASILLVSKEYIYNPITDPATPEADPVGHEFEWGTQVEVTLSCTTPGTTIYYTTDGSEPTMESYEYILGPIIIEDTTTLKARAYLTKTRFSDVMTEVYTEGTPP